MMDPRQFYLQWAAAGNPLAANPYLAGGMRPPGPLPAPYLHSLAQFHNLKALATKTFLEQQNLAKSILQQSQPSHTASASHCECLDYTSLFSFLQKKYFPILKDCSSSSSIFSYNRSSRNVNVRPFVCLVQTYLGQS